MYDNAVQLKNAQRWYKGKAEKSYENVQRMKVTKMVI